jgi:hypothetical protein
MGEEVNAYARIDYEHFRQLDLDSALERYAESYGPCSCGSDFTASDGGRWTIKLTCNNCGMVINKYGGPDYD